MTLILGILLGIICTSIALLFYLIYVKLNTIELDIYRFNFKIDDIHSELLPTNPDDSSLYTKLKLREDMPERK